MMISSKRFKIILLTLSASLFIFSLCLPVATEIFLSDEGSTQGQVTSIRRMYGYEFLYRGGLGIFNVFALGNENDASFYWVWLSWLANIFGLYTYYLNIKNQQINQITKKIVVHSVIAISLASLFYFFRHKKYVTSWNWYWGVPDHITAYFQIETSLGYYLWLSSFIFLFLSSILSFYSKQYILLNVPKNQLTIRLNGFHSTLLFLLIALGFFGLWFIGIVNEVR